MGRVVAAAAAVGCVMPDAGGTVGKGEREGIGFCGCGKGRVYGWEETTSGKSTGPAAAAPASR